MKYTLAIFLLLLILPYVYSQNLSNTSLESVTGQTVKEFSAGRIFLGIIVTLIILALGIMAFVTYINQVKK